MLLAVFNDIKNFILILIVLTAGFAHALGCKRCAVALVGNTRAPQTTTPAADSDSAVTIAMTPMDTSADTFNAQWAGGAGTGSVLRPRAVPTVMGAVAKMRNLVQRATAGLRGATSRRRLLETSRAGWTMRRPRCPTSKRSCAAGSCYFRLE